MRTGTAGRHEAFFARALFLVRVCLLVGHTVPVELRCNGHPDCFTRATNGDGAVHERQYPACFALLELVF